MKILQFRCSVESAAVVLKQRMIDQINIWSRLNWLTTDPEYVTEKYNISLWKQHLIHPDLWWLDYDQIYENIGDDGRLIADQLLGDGPLEGILKNTPFIQSLPETILEIISIDNLELEGYEEPTV